MDNTTCRGGAYAAVASKNHDFVSFIMVRATCVSPLQALQTYFDYLLKKFRILAHSPGCVAERLGLAISTLPCTISGASASSTSPS